MAQETIEVRTKFSFALPAVGFTMLMVAFPFLYSLYLSGFDFTFGSDPYFIGLENYGNLLNDPEFWNGFKISVIIYVGSLALQLVSGTYLGILLYNSQRMSGFLRTTLISPFVLPPVVVGMMWVVILDPSLGAANYLLKSIGLPTSLWLASPTMVVPTFILLDTWQWTPFVALIILGGLQSLPPSVYEAAAIDGAGRFKTFFRITLPLLMPTVVTAAILRSVDLLRFFDLIYITTQGGPGNSSNALNVYAFRVGFEYYNFGYACALMLTLTTIVIGSVIVLQKARSAVSW